MKYLRLALLPLVGALLSAGCGPSAGASCKSGYVCDSQTQALECRNGEWRAVPCKGALGCTELSSTVRCDTSANVAGDACAASAEGHAQCTQDGKGLLECRQGLLVQTQSCSACGTSGSEVTCSP
jgi:hypothetical protein